MRHIRIGRPSPALVVAVLALFVATGVPADAARSINGALLKNQSVGTSKLKIGAITNNRLANNSVTASKIKAGAIINNRLATNSVTASKILAGAVGLSDMAPTAVAALTQVPPNAIGGTQVADNSLTGADIGQNSIAADEIVSNAIRASELATNSVDSDEIRNGSQGAADFAQFVGSFVHNFPAIAPNDCVQATFDVASIIAGRSLLDDVIVLTPDATFGQAKIVVVAAPSAATQIRVQACNQTALGIDPAEATFRYASFDIG